MSVSVLRFSRQENDTTSEKIVCKEKCTFVFSKFTTKPIFTTYLCNSESITVNKQQKTLSFDNCMNRTYTINDSISIDSLFILPYIDVYLTANDTPAGLFYNNEKYPWKSSGGKAKNNTKSTKPKWTSTGQKIKQKDGKTRTIYENERGTRAVKKMVDKDGKKTAKYFPIKK
jgi:hypothetical protein